VDVGNTGVGSVEGIGANIMQTLEDFIFVLWWRPKVKVKWEARLHLVVKMNKVETKKMLILIPPVVVVVIAPLG
jgi:hypothetical protein